MSDAVLRGSTSLVLDNLSTHKHKRDIYLARHKNVSHYHSDPLAE
jgi:hypothetical protein